MSSIITGKLRRVSAADCGLIGVFAMFPLGLYVSLIKMPLEGAGAFAYLYSFVLSGAFGGALVALFANLGMRCIGGVRLTITADGPEDAEGHYEMPDELKHPD